MYILRVFYWRTFENFEINITELSSPSFFISILHLHLLNYINTNDNFYLFILHFYSYMSRNNNIVAAQHVQGG